MKIQTLQLFSMRNLLLPVSVMGMGSTRIKERSKGWSMLNGRSLIVRRYSAAPPPPGATGTVSTVNNVTLNIRKIGTHVTRPSVLVKDHQLTLNEMVYSLVSQAVLDEVSLKSLLEENPEVKRFICKVALETASAASATGSEMEVEEVGKQHPFIKVAGELFFQEDDFPSSLSTPGILVYLMGKLFQRDPYDDHSALAKKIRHLSKSVNHSCAAFRIHRTIQETSGKPVWNKLATLAGDLLVVECIRNVASIGDNELLLWTMNSLADFSSSEFQPKGHRSQLILKPEGSLLSTGFRGVAKLAGHQEPQLQRQLNHLGMTLGYLWMENEADFEDSDSSEPSPSTSVSVNAMMEQSLEILTQQFHGSDSDVTGFFRDFILYYSQSQLEHSPITMNSAAVYSHKSIHVI